MSTGWLPNSLNTLKNRNFSEYDLKIFIIFSAEHSAEKRIFNLGRENNILIERECTEA